MGAPWVLVAWAEQFRRELDALAPGRDKTSDGSVGDLRHSVGVSGHNPDDTAGTRAERQDADSIPEVRAIDVDRDLRRAGVTVEQLVAWLVGRCRAGKETRLIYIIFNRTIWSAAGGWQARRYTGSNPHDKHIHLSGDPAADTDGRPFGLAALAPQPKPTAPKPAPPAGRPAPGPAVTFPLPGGHYFGPASGPDQSVSGEHNRVFRGRTDRSWLKTWAEQIARRGWPVGRGRRWLGSGNDGLYGDEYRALIAAFQRDMGLPVDGLLGAATWNAAYRARVR